VTEEATSSGVSIVGVVGAGVMGAGIAQVAIEAGCEVVVYDVDPDASERARSRIRDGLGRRAARLELDADSIDDWVDGRLERLRHSPTLDGIAGEADLVIEAAVEDLLLKSALFRTLDAEARPDTILATNTSALSVAAIAEATTTPSRVLGLHFFNPVPRMELVELVAPPLVDQHVVDSAAATMRTWGKTAIRCTDTPGFIVNRVNRPFTLEAMAVVEEGAAAPEAIDAAVRAAGFPLGPFELMDLTGLDVTTAASGAIYLAAVAAGDPRAERFRPSPVQEELVEAGRLGRKTGQGFYAYDANGRRTDAPVDPVPAGPEVIERLTLAIVNEAFAALGDGVARASDIDRAMRLGVGHPVGPFERADALGGAAVVVEALRRWATRGPRFEPAGALLVAAGTTDTSD
jgi:3-hydroxybutyryl-CoA dehydrogenase